MERDRRVTLARRVFLSQILALSSKIIFVFAVLIAEKTVNQSDTTLLLGFVLPVCDC